MNKQIVNVDFLEREASLYRNAESIDKMENDINKLIVDNTKHEKKELENALIIIIKKYQRY